jgi:hypothetical protein
MRANDTEARKLLMQSLDFVRIGAFEIQHYRFRAITGDHAADLSIGGRQVNVLEVLGKTGRQIARGSGIILIENYAELFH